MKDPSKVYLKNGMCPFKKGPDDIYHECNMSSVPHYDGRDDRFYACAHGEWSKSWNKPMAPCDPDSPDYNTRLWRSVNKPKPYVYDKDHEDRVARAVRGIMNLLPPIGTDNEDDEEDDKKERSVNYSLLNFQPYNFIKRTDENDDDEMRGFMQIRRKKLLKQKVRKPIKKPIKKTIKKKICICKKK